MTLIKEFSNSGKIAIYLLSGFPFCGSNSFWDA
jgi:hypothetical protein